MARADRITLIRAIEAKRHSKVFCLLTSDRPNMNVMLQKDVLPRIAAQLRKGPRNEAIDLFLFTQGGDTIAGFGIARLLREYADRVNVLVPDRCHSAGTLIALGANEILMTKSATLSPIDPSIIRPLNPAIQTNPAQPAQLIPLSVESVAGFASLAKNEWKIKSDRDLAEIFRILSEKVHPLALGDVFRARQQIEHLAKELMRQHRKDGGAINRAIYKLSKGLGSHDYLVYRTEAVRILGKQVKPDDEISEELWTLFQDFSQEMELGVPFDPNLALGPITPSANPGMPRAPRRALVSLKLAVVESSDQSDMAIKKVAIDEVLVQQPNGVPAYMVTPPVDQFAGWVTDA